MKVILVTVACLQLGYSQNCLRDEISAAFTREVLANNNVYDGLLEKINETTRKHQLGSAVRASTIAVPHYKRNRPSSKPWEVTLYTSSVL